VFRSLGLHWRAKLLRDLGRALAEGSGHVPDDYDELMALPGVGTYAASAWLSLHRSRRAVLVDSNIVRWLARMSGRPYDGETRRRVWVRELADEITPRQGVSRFNYALLDFTMLICRPLPRCGICPFAASMCEYARKRRSAKR
jgi:A/G-specific adenine glycosylase